MKEFMIAKSSIMEIQSFVFNPKSKPNFLNFYSIMFPTKIIDKTFQYKEKSLFWGVFCPKGIFPKTLG